MGLTFDLLPGLLEQFLLSHSHLRSGLMSVSIQTQTRTKVSCKENLKMTKKAHDKQFKQQMLGFGDLIGGLEGSWWGTLVSQVSSPWLATGERGAVFVCTVTGYYCGFVELWAYLLIRFSVVGSMKAWTPCLLSSRRYASQVKSVENVFPILVYLIPSRRM